MSQAKQQITPFSWQWMLKEYRMEIGDGVAFKEDLRAMARLYYGLGIEEGFTDIVDPDGQAKYWDPLKYGQGGN